MNRQSWLCTLATQMSLCCALYLALNLGQPQKFYRRETSGRPHDLYFISVRGGSRPLIEQTQLLKLMENVAKTYDARFVVNISVLGEDDPLKQNATKFFPSLKVPWYSTRVSSTWQQLCFLKEIKLPHGRTLNIIGLDTGSWQDTMLTGSSSGTNDSMLKWLTRTLEATKSNWCIVIGFHPLVPCKANREQMEAKWIYEPLHHIFMKFGVNVYLSRPGCSPYAHQDGVAYIGNPGLNLDEPPLASSSGRSVLSREMANGFLLHRVSLLEIVTYFVTSAGDVVHDVVVQQRGKEVM